MSYHYFDSEHFLGALKSDSHYQVGEGIYLRATFMLINQ
jgi:hypothetical protein